MRDRNGEDYFLVLKNGIKTKLTVGRANGIFSIVCDYFKDGTDQTTREWSILANDGVKFSARGDSGAVVVDGRGRIGGLLTGGTGKLNLDALDVSYATPFFWLMKSIKENGFPNAHIYPTRD
ncbi:hypothetical protein TWF696_000110 [Orbilia brochopaga]|uniref:Peptidase S1 domain-containing protein n=1 Tax=Orbilia brochopaga TaxID=3140254 RepID=A0AAV9VAB4_9PEZI